MCRPEVGLKQRPHCLIRAWNGVTSIFSEFQRSTYEPGSYSKKPAGGKPKSSANLADGQTFTLEDVAEHCTREDCWIVVKNKVYDVSTFAPQHPGSVVIYTYGGKDATDAFSTFHAASTWSLLRKYFIGELVEAASVSPLLEDFRNLRAALMSEGLFRSNKVYYVFKLASTGAILALALAMLFMAARSSWFAFVGSAFLLGLFWQQSGWLAHDFLHHQVFSNRNVNNAIGLVLGNVCQGFSVGWWKAKHNTHHAAPNELCPEGMQAVDPDIDTLPLLAWSSDMLLGIRQESHRTLIRLQAYLFFPILAFARVAWCHSSLLFVSDLAKEKNLAGSWEEVLYLGLHYAWFLGCVIGTLPLLKALAFMILAQVFAGMMLSIVFVQSHNGMEVYHDKKDFVTAQIVSTRDIAPSLWNDWFSGGLNFQIEHHLFPSLPRHNLGKVSKRVRELCEKHGLTYESCGMVKGTCLVLKRLSEVAALA